MYFNQDWIEFLKNRNQNFFNASFLITKDSLFIFLCRNLLSYRYLLEASLSLRLIPSVTLVLTVSSLTVSLTEEGLLSKNKLKSSSLISDRRSWCVIRMINYAGNNIFLIFLVLSMILNVGRQNILNFHVILMTLNVGGNSFQVYPVILKTLNAGENLDHIREEPLLIRLQKVWEILEDLPIKRKDNLEKSLTRLEIMQAEKLNRPNNSQETRLNKLNIELKEQHNQQLLQLDLNFQEQNSMLLIKPKLWKIKLLVENNMWRIKLLMQRT